MVTASRILGDEVGSTAPTFLAVLAVHVLAGVTGHIAGMGIGYTAMITAFYVDNGPHLPLWDRLPVLAFWLLPAAIAAPIITRAIIRAKNKARLSGSETSPAAGSSESRPGAA